MARTAKLGLFLFLLLLLPAAAHAQCFVTVVCVSSITGGTTITGGSTTNATVTATITRPPGFTGSATVTFTLTGPLTSTSPLTQTIPSGSDTASITVWGSLVGQATAASVKALDPNSPDPGQTTNFTVAAMPLTLTLNPNQLNTPTNETGIGKLRTGEPLRVGSSFGYNGSLLTLTGSTPFPTGGQDASFTYKPANVSVRQSGTVTVTLGPVSAQATVTLLPGGNTTSAAVATGAGRAESPSISPTATSGSRSRTTRCPAWVEA